MHTRPPEGTPGYTGEYGFAVPTHCGVTEQDNTWEDSWEVFYRDRRLGDLVKRIGDGQISKEWDRLKQR
jgi:protein-ribulosamine 3-kinase